MPSYHTHPHSNRLQGSTLDESLHAVFHELKVLSQRETGVDAPELNVKVASNRMDLLVAIINSYQSMLAEDASLEGLHSVHADLGYAKDTVTIWANDGAAILQFLEAAQKYSQSGQVPVMLIDEGPRDVAQLVRDIHNYNRDPAADQVAH